MPCFECALRQPGPAFCTLSASYACNSVMSIINLPCLFRIPMWHGSCSRLIGVQRPAQIHVHSNHSMPHNCRAAKREAVARWKACKAVSAAEKLQEQLRAEQEQKEAADRLRQVQGQREKRTAARQEQACTLCLAPCCCQQMAALL